MASPGAPVLSLRGLGKSFAGHLSLTKKSVVEGITLDVLPGEIFGFLGQNGAGKTTTIKMIVGLIFPTRGSVEIMGQPAARAGARGRLGYLPENPYFYDYLTAEEFLRYYGHLYGIPRDELARRIPAVLARVGLAGKEALPLRKYSKGMVQRVGIAQAILNDPAVVVLDEPMSGLDPIGRRDVRDIMLELRARGTTVFFSSHILQDAEMICDRVGILVQGRLVTVGPLSDLLTRKADTFEVQVERVGPDVFASLGTRVERLSERNGAQLLRVATEADLREVLSRTLAAGGRVERVAPRRETLEELFLRASDDGRAG
ncbi:MAG: ABC transporter ATP-binding protein [Acidobacteriota bacterium]